MGLLFFPENCLFIRCLAELNYVIYVTFLMLIYIYGLSLKVLIGFLIGNRIVINYDRCMVIYC